MIGMNVGMEGKSTMNAGKKEQLKIRVVLKKANDSKH